MSVEPDDRSFEPTSVDAEAATRLLHYATGASRQAWSSLLERLHRIDGHGWATLRLEACFGPSPVPTAIPLDRLIAAKESAKLEVAAAPDLETQATAWLTYATAVAVAAAFHGIRLSTMPTEAWIEVFSELSALMPEPWAGVFESAMAGWMG
ncbi:MAG: hypothetical protein JNL80_13395 [Phycisphaerae bacterium]|nr:hypothetical protein [Phycisphaerae bacterium]